MKRTFALLMLAISINGKTIAQDEPVPGKTDRFFNMPTDNITRSFYADLGKGNKMQISVTDIDDLQRFKNADSLLLIFLHDMLAFTDSLRDETASRRIDYFTDELGRKQIRIRLNKPQGSAFLIQQDQVAMLKMEQDTISFSGSYIENFTSTILKPHPQRKYYQLTFFVNRFSDLEKLTGTINEKVQAIDNNKQKRWIKDKEGNWRIKGGDQSVYSMHQPAGYTAVAGPGDYIASRLAAGIQNYKNYFVPSVSLGAGFVFNNGRVRYGFDVLGEFHFMFARNAQGNLQTYRNTFLTLHYRRTIVNRPASIPAISFVSDFSFAYLLKRRGDFFEKNTMRIGVGQLSFLKERVNIEPVFYFNNLFKGVTPGLKLTVNF